MNILSPSVASQLAEFAYDSVGVVSGQSSNIDPGRVVSKSLYFRQKSNQIVK